MGYNKKLIVRNVKGKGGRYLKVLSRHFAGGPE
jgi:hypothetical protein